MEELEDVITEDDRLPLLRAAEKINRLEYGEWDESDWLDCLIDAGVRDEIVEGYRDYLEEYPGTLRYTDSAGQTISPLLGQLDMGPSYRDEWVDVSCPTCGSSNVVETQYDYHDVLVFCEDCGERTHTSR